MSLMLLLKEIFWKVLKLLSREEAENGMLSKFTFKGARNKRDIALKADAEAAMEKLAAGLKTESGLRYHSKRRRKTSCSWKSLYTMKDR
jgi:hypothetical protein